MQQICLKWGDARADYVLALLSSDVPMDTISRLQEIEIAARTRMESHPSFIACGPEHLEAIGRRDERLWGDPRWRQRLVPK